jgi:hypothetical protein
MFKKILLSILALIFCFPLFSQYTALKYKWNFPDFVMHKDSQNIVHTELVKAEQDFYIYVYKDKRALSFVESNLEKKTQTKSVDLYDRKKSEFIGLYVRKSDKTGDIYITRWRKKDWCKIDPMHPPYIDEFMEESITEAMKKKDSLWTWQPPQIAFTDSIKTIGEYKCKNAIVTEGKTVYNVWYTEQFDYSWCFSDYRFLIPGTVIYSERNGEIDFVLEEITYPKKIDEELERAMKFR